MAPVPRQQPSPGSAWRGLIGLGRSRAGLGPAWRGEAGHGAARPGEAGVIGRRVGIRVRAPDSHAVPHGLHDFELTERGLSGRGMAGWGMAEHGKEQLNRNEWLSGEE